MSEMYKATSPKNPDTNYTEEVVFEKDNDGNVTESIIVGGAPVELSDEQLEAARRYLNVRKATDEEKEVASGGPNEDDSPDTASEEEEAAEQQTASEPGVRPPNSPAAAEARTELGSKSRRGGGDK